MDNNLKENLKNLIEEIFSKMDFEAKIDVDDSQSGFVMVNIQSDEAGLLIGQGGENLLALQHICRLIANKKLGSEPLNFIVDVNNYKENRLALLKEMALTLARQVTSEGRPKILEPMPSYERRIIHLALKEFGGVKTESQGEGLLRRVVIKPGSDVI
jgi:spoIIIJ-associated protein